jgi:DNA-binding response OmpR family regulator
MRPRVDPLGNVLLRTGALAEEALMDVLDQQRHTLPLASLCYVLGYADEETLARALSRQFGVPGVVLDRSVIRLDVLDGVSRDLLMHHNMLLVHEDERRIFVAAENPRMVAEVMRELPFVRGKALVPHVALHVTLARTLRACYAARARGQRFVSGHLADAKAAGERGSMVVVSDADHHVGDAHASPAHEAVVEDVTKELVSLDLFKDADQDTGVDPLDEKVARGSLYAYSPQFGKQTPTITQAKEPESLVSEVELMLGGGQRVIDLDDGDGAGYSAAHAGPKRILIVDDDFATRHLLVKELQPLGFITMTASSGGEAVRQIKASPPDMAIIDVMLPEIDGFQICRAIKQSQKYQHIAVILMSAVIDSGRVTDEVLRRYGADAYFEKPLNTERIRRRLVELLDRQGESAPTGDDDSFQRAIALYKAGDLDRAIEVLRAGLEVDPLSAKHHFVLANLLQKKSLVYEAIDEYETTIDLKPDYFPALTRLAYLYYKKGFSAKAVEMWRRSLPHCSDATLRQNIEVFMRKLIADMESGHS